MTSQSGPDDAPTRVLLAAGTARYDSPQHPSLELVPHALATVVEALRSRGFTPLKSSTKDEVEQWVADLGVTLDVPEIPGFLRDPDPGVLEDALSEAARAAPVVVFYYTGHGLKPEGGQYRVVPRGADPGRPHTYVRVADLLEDLTPREAERLNFESSRPDVLVILDCCESGGVSEEMLRAALRESRRTRIWVLATARQDESAIQGRFADALAQALDEADVGAVMPFIPMSEVIRLVQKRLPNTGMDQQHLAALPPDEGITGSEPFFANPSFKPEVAEGVGEGLQHWLSRVRGLDDRADLGLYLAGRDGRVRAAARLADWMNDPQGSGLAVVTGSPGCGKSTLMAIPALLTGSEATRTLLTADSANRNKFVAAIADRIPLDTSVAAIHARGLTADAVADRIADHLGRPSASARDLVTQVVDEEADVTPSVLIVDAVDEASHPTDLVRSLLEPLSRHPDLRVLLATRRNVLPSVRDDHLLFDLDSPEYQDPDALTDYVAELLAATYEPDLTTPYREVAPAAVRQVAEALALRASAELPEDQRAESFLLGRLLAVAVRSRPEPVDSTGPDWLQHLPASVGAAFDEDIDRRLGEEIVQGRALLTALAWSRGLGLPREGIWSAVAQAICDRSSPPANVTEANVRKILNRAGSYIVEAIGPSGRAVYRLFHALLAQHLRCEPTQEESTADPTLDEQWQQEQRQVEAIITGALLTVGPRTPASETDWELAHPYLRTHLAEHAAAAGAGPLHDLVTDPDFLAMADPSTLTSLLDATDSTTGDLARIYRQARAQLSDRPSDNVASLAEAACALAMTWPGPGRIVPTYTTLFALSPRDDSALSFWAGQGGVRSLAFTTVAPGRTVLLVGDEQGGLQVWEPGRGVALSPRLQNHRSAVRSIATANGGDGATFALSSDIDLESRWWRVDADGQLTQLSGQPDTALTIEGGTLPSLRACTRDPASGELVTASSWADVDADGVATIHLEWSGGRALDVSVPVGTSAPYVDVALSSAAGDVVLGVGAPTGALTLWTLEGQRIGGELRVMRRPLWEALAISSKGAVAGPSATGDQTGLVQLWDVGAPPPSGAFGRRVVDRVALVAADAPLLAVATHSPDGLFSVRLLDPTTGSERRPALTFSLKCIDALLAGRSNGRAFVCAYSGMDWRIDIRRLNGSGDTSLPVPGSYTHVAVASGDDSPALIALGSASAEAPVLVYDAETGQIVDQPIPLARRVTALDVVRHGAEALVAIGSRLPDTCAVYRLGVTEPPVPIEMGSTAVSCLRFLRREEDLLLAVGHSSGQVEVHYIDHGERVSEPLWSSRPPAPAAAISCMTFSHAAGDPVLITGSEDGTVAVFAASSGHPLLHPLHRRGAVRSVDALPTGELAIHDDAGLTVIRVPWRGQG